MSSESHNNKFELIVAPAIFLGTGAATAAVSGVSLVSPVGLGILLASGINSLSSTAISKLFDASVKDAPFFKISATVAAIGLTTFGTYMAAPLLAPASAIILTQEMALAVGLVSIATKTATATTQQFLMKTNAETPAPPSQEPVGPRSRRPKPQEKAPTGPRARLQRRQNPLAERVDTPPLGPLNWKKVGVVAFSALALLAPIAYWLTSPFLISEPIPHDLAPLLPALVPTLVPAPPPPVTPLQTEDQFFFLKLLVPLLSVSTLFGISRFFSRSSSKKTTPSAPPGSVSSSIKSLDKVFDPSIHGAGASAAAAAEAAPTIDIPFYSPIVSKEDKLLQAWREFVEVHCPNLESPDGKSHGFTKAKKQVLEGRELIRKLWQGEAVTTKNLEYALECVCWALMFHAIAKNQHFQEGMFDFLDPGHRIFELFKSSITHDRASTHYSHRASQHKGYDTNNLPIGKRTVLIGPMDNSPDQLEQRSYLKMENWGANIRDPSMQNLYQLACHFGEFVQSKAAQSGLCSQVGAGAAARKEHLPDADKTALETFKRELDQANFTPSLAFNLAEYGFSHGIPYITAALESTLVTPDLKKRIQDYIDAKRVYDHLNKRKGNEVIVDQSLLGSAFDRALTKRDDPEDHHFNAINRPVLWLETLKTLQDPKKRIEPQAVSLYLHTLKEIHVVENFLNPYSDPTTPDAIATLLTSLPKDKKSVIPVSNKSWGSADQSAKSMVVFVFDPQSKKITYYDPCSKSCSVKIERGAEEALLRLIKKIPTSDSRATRPLWSALSRGGPSRDVLVNSEVFVCDFVRCKTSDRSKSQSSAQDARATLARELRNAFDLTTKDPASAQAFLKERLPIQFTSRLEHVIPRTASAFLTKTPEQTPSYDKTEIFHQVDRDIQRGGGKIMLSDKQTTAESAKDVFDDLMSLLNNEQKALQALALMQQGLIGEVMEPIGQHLGLDSREDDPKYLLNNRGTKGMSFSITADKDTLNLSGSTPLHLIDMEGNLTASFEVSVKIDFQAGTLKTVLKFLEPADSSSTSSTSSTSAPISPGSPGSPGSPISDGKTEEE